MRYSNIRGPFPTRRVAEMYVNSMMYQEITISQPARRITHNGHPPITCVEVMRHGTMCWEPLRDVRHDPSAIVYRDHRKVRSLAPTLPPSDRTGGL